MILIVLPRNVQMPLEQEDFVVVILQGVLLLAIGMDKERIYVS